MNHLSKQSSRTHGFSLIELMMIIVIVGLVAAIIAPALEQVRSQSRSLRSSDNLMQIGQGRDLYATDNADRIFTYTWRADETYVLPDGRIRTPRSDLEAAAYQNTEILMRRTGRINGLEKITTNLNRLPHRRFSHLPLMDYMTAEEDAFPNPVFADPADGDLLNWQERPLSYLSFTSGIPYSFFSDVNGIDDDPSWNERSVQMRWSFGTSYQSTPFAWQNDGPNGVYVPLQSTPHLYLSNGGVVDLSGRYMNQVAFPSRKVHLFEEFDREQKRYPYFAYDHARPDKLMFDGSVDSRLTEEAEASASPAHPGEDWAQRYLPLHTFPIPVDGLGSDEELNMPYRWTRDGLQGFDFTK